MFLLELVLLLELLVLGVLLLEELELAVLLLELAVDLMERLLQQCCIHVCKELVEVREEWSW